MKLTSKNGMGRQGHLLHIEKLSKEHYSTAAELFWPLSLLPELELQLISKPSIYCDWLGRKPSV